VPESVFLAIVLLAPLLLIGGGVGAVRFGRRTRSPVAGAAGWVVLAIGGVVLACLVLLVAALLFVPGGEVTWCC
jgi:hypothetical protein